MLRNGIIRTHGSRLTSVSSDQQPRLVETRKQPASRQPSQGQRPTDAKNAVKDGVNKVADAANKKL
jgi:hypothetical protein